MARPILLPFCLAAVVVAGSGWCGAAEPGVQARTLIQASGFDGGFAAHLGVTDGNLTAALAHEERFIVHGLTVNRHVLEAARSRIRELNLYGRVSVDYGPVHPLPYADNLVNLLVVSRPLAELGEAIDFKDVFRVLTPNGLLALPVAEGAGVGPALSAAGFAKIRTAGDWTLALKPRPAGMDDWTHARYSPAGTTTSRDALTGPPRSLRWVYDPHIVQRHGGSGSSIFAAVTANGRLYQILEYAPPFMATPSNQKLIARDAFNGVILWERPVQIRNLGGRRRTRGLHRPGDGVAVDGDTLYTLLDNDEHLVALDGRTGEILREYKDATPDATLILGDRLLLMEQADIRLIDKNDGTTRWKKNVGGYYNTLFHGDGRVFCHIPRQQTLICLDLETGEEQWTLEKQSGVLMQGYAKQTLVVTQGNTIRALSAADGSEKWSHAYRRSGRAAAAWAVLFADGLVWVYEVRGRETGQPAAWIGLDLDTGKTLRTWPVGFDDKCAPPRATDRQLIPGRLVFTDTRTGDSAHTGAARGACSFGALPANGMLYTFPIDCQCASYLIGTMGFGPEHGLPQTNRAERLEKGPAFGSPAGPEPDPIDWPVYRANPERQGSSAARPPARLVQRWTRALDAPLSPPVAADGKVFVASIESRLVHAVNADNGKPLWRFHADGRVVSPPTYSQGRVYFGCRNGWVYAVQADNGELAWRFRAAPDRRLLIAYGQPESVWPVEGSLLVLDDTIYGSVGRHTGLNGGVSLFALNRQGQLIWEHPASNETFADMLVKEDDWLLMQKAQHSIETGLPPEIRRDRIGAPTFSAGRISTFRQTSYTPRAQWRMSGIGTSPIMAFDSQRASGVHVFNDDKYSVFRPAETGCKLWLQKRDARQPVWETDIPIRPKGLVLTPDHVYIAGPEDAWPPKTASLRIYAAADGKETAALDLAAPPVFDGLIATRDRLFMTATDGHLVCFGE